MLPTEHVLAKIEELGNKDSAEYFGVSTAMISNIASRKAPPSMRFLERLINDGKLVLAPPSEAPAPPLAPTEEQWDTTKRDLAILTPSYKDVQPTTSDNFCRLWNKAKMQKCVRHGNYLVRQRNWLATWALGIGVEWTYWQDDDIVVPCGDAAWFRSIAALPDMPTPFAGLHTINRLVNSARTNKASIVGGSYFGRTKHAWPQNGIGQDNPSVRSELKQGPHDRLYATNWVGTGCLLVHRSVYEDILRTQPGVDPKPELRGTENEFEERLKGEGELCFDFFGGMLGKGEDVSFCEKATACGHQILLDAAVQCIHWGTYPFTYADAIA